MIAKLTQAVILSTSITMAVFLNTVEILA